MDSGREVGAQGMSSASVHCTSTSTLDAYSAAPSVSAVEPQLRMRCSTTARVASTSMPLRCDASVSHGECISVGVAASAHSESSHEIPCFLGVWNE